MSKGGNSSKGGAQQYGVNPMQNAASGLQQAFTGTQNAMNANQGFGAQGFGQYDPAMMQAATAGNAQGYNAQQAGPAQGFNAAQTGPAQGFDATSYQAMMQNAPGMIASGMSNYQNPYESQVIGNTTADMQKANQVQQEQIRAQAAAAGAFGGGRHGLVEATSNNDNLKSIGDMSAQMRAQGFNTAAQLSGQDIANQMTVGGQNQAAGNQASQYNASNMQDARSFAAQAANSNNQYNAGNRQDAAKFGAGENNLTSRFNTGETNAGRQFNANANNQQNQFNAGLRQDSAVSNQNARNQAGQYNAGAQQSNLQNMVGNMGSLASQQGSNAQNSYNIGNNINQNQLAAGGMSQNLQQQLMGQSGNMFDQYTGTPAQQLQMRLAALGMNPLSGAGTTTETTDNSGQLFGQLLGAASNMVSFAPITLSDMRSKHNIVKTGKTAVFRDGSQVPEVAFTYIPSIDPTQERRVGVVAQDLVQQGSSAAKMTEQGLYGVDYSQRVS
jgi:hypothetical protein